MKAHSQFLRRSKLVVGDTATGIDLSALHFQFSVKMADLTHPQYATFRIYNMAPTTLNTIKANEYREVLFEAGYQHGSYGAIFAGEVIQATQGHDAPEDSYLDLLCAVGHSSYQAGISQTLAAGASSTDVASAAAGAMGQPLNNYADDNGTKMPRGQVLYGPAHEIMTEAANASGATWFYQSDGVTMTSTGKPIPGGTIILNGGTGLVGYPQQTQEGIRVRCLLNPIVKVGTTIELNNATIQREQIDPGQTYVNTLPGINADGLYRVLYFEHNGDTRGNDWYTDSVCLSVDQTSSGITTLYKRGLL